MEEGAGTVGTANATTTVAAAGEVAAAPPAATTTAAITAAITTGTAMTAAVTTDVMTGAEAAPVRASAVADRGKWHFQAPGNQKRKSSLSFRVVYQVFGRGFWVLVAECPRCRSSSDDDQSLSSK